MSITVDSVVVVAKDQLSAELRGEAVVLGLEKGIYYGLDEVGARVWQLVQEPKKVSEIRDTIVLEYEVDPATCQRDVVEFLDRLSAEGLLEVSHAPRR